MTRFENKVFTELWSVGKAVCADMEFVKCQFVRCTVADAGVSDRCTIRNVRLLNCVQEACLLVGPVLQDILVDGLKGQMLEICGGFFERVILRGRIDRLWMNPGIGDGTKTELFANANAELYKNVEWALDIGQVDSKEMYVAPIPIQLVRRDAETQAAVTRENVVEGKWRQLPFQCGAFEVQLDQAAKDEYPGVILVVPKRHPKAKRYLEDIAMLRKEGIAEPD